MRRRAQRSVSKPALCAPRAITAAKRRHWAARKRAGWPVLGRASSRASPPWRQAAMAIIKFVMDRPVEGRAGRYAARIGAQLRCPDIDHSPRHTRRLIQILCRARRSHHAAGQVFA
jgi:hypothetical protein